MSQCFQSSGSIRYLTGRLRWFRVDTVSRRVFQEATSFPLQDSAPPDSSPSRRPFQPYSDGAFNSITKVTTQLFLDVAVFGYLVCTPRQFWFESYSILQMISYCLQSIPDCLKLGLESRYVISGIRNAGKARRHPFCNGFDLLGPLQYHLLCCFHTEELSLCIF